MDKYLICLKSKQLVDNDEISQNYEGELYVSNLGVLTYDISYKEQIILSEGSVDYDKEKTYHNNHIIVLGSGRCCGSSCRYLGRN